MNESALSTERRHEIDALRVLVLLLLIVYHAMLSFHPVAPWLLLPQNGQLLDWIHGPMALVNVWRIPLLFVISGMAIWFSLTHLSVREVLIHRLRRIAGPWILGWFVLGPLCFYMGTLFFAQPAYYAPNPHYLWFLNNILVYMVLLTPLAAYAVGNGGQSLRRGLATGWRRGYIPLVALLLFAGEAGIINPKFYTLYFTGPHGWLLGFLCFALGICCAAGGSDFRHFVGRFRYVSLAFAFALYMGRVSYYEIENAPNVLVGMEGLPDVDRKYLTFGDLFEDKLVQQAGVRPLEQSMQAGWELLRALPVGELSRLSDDQIDKYLGEA